MHNKFNAIVVVSEAFIIYSIQVQLKTVQSLRLCLIVNLLEAELYTHRFPSVD